MTIFDDVKERIAKQYQQMSITTVDRSLYLRIAEYLSENSGSSTYMASRKLGIPCDRLRKYLKQMQDRDLVSGCSNGSNNINWRLQP